jgi:hypothetical protein
MRYVLLLCTLLASVGLGLFAQEPAEGQKPTVPCLTVTPRTTDDAHETHPLYIGPLYIGARFNYVDGARITSPKLVYNYRDLEKLHDAGTHIVVLPLHYTPGELQMAKRACEVTDP